MNLRSQNKIKMENGMSSMTDLVFLMLIFFIVISSFIATGHNIDLPAGGGTADKHNTKVYVDSTNRYFINDNNTPIVPDSLENAILNALAIEESDTSAIELMGDKNSSWEYSVKVIDIAKQNKLAIVIKTKG